MQSDIKKILQHPKLDFIGFAASLLCAIHCAVLPFLLSLAPLAGFHLLANPMVEYSVIAVGLLVGSFSLLHGYRHHHHKSLPLYMIVAGFVLIFAGHLLLHTGNSQELIMTVMGALLVATAHLANQYYVRRTNKKATRRLQSENCKQLAA